MIVAPDGVDTSGLSALLVDRPDVQVRIIDTPVKGVDVDAVAAEHHLGDGHVTIVVWRESVAVVGVDSQLAERIEKSGVLHSTPVGRAEVAVKQLPVVERVETVGQGADASGGTSDPHNSGATSAVLVVVLMAVVGLALIVFFYRRAARVPAVENDPVPLRISREIETLLQRVDVLLAAAEVRELTLLKAELMSARNSLREAGKGFREIHQESVAFERYTADVESKLAEISQLVKRGEATVSETRYRGATERLHDI